MKSKTVVKYLSILASSIILTGCGGGGGTSENSSGGAGSHVGYLTDSPIAGMNYACGARKGITDDHGKFSCDTVPVVFSVGDYVVGTISQIPSDSRVFPQDLLGLSRDNSTDPKLVELTQFLQALDDDRNISERITITEEMRNRFKGSGSENSGGNGDGGSSEGLPPGKVALKQGIPLPNPVTAMDHLRKSVTPQDYRPADTTDKSKYMGKWIGNGWGWEVRFKQNYGQFVSQFTGVDKEDLPFKGEKNIMSLMVVHQTVFSLDVDQNGNIDGTGTITYDLIPNLCGLYALTNNVVNPAVNMFDKIFTLSGIVSQKNALEATDGLINFDNKILSFAYNRIGNVDTGASFFGKDWASQLSNSVKNTYLEAEKTNNICKTVQPNPHVKGGLSVGPMSLDDLLANASVDVGKTVLQTVISGDLGNVVGLMLSVPGVTQVQYSYKGLKDGPETRIYKISGHIDDSGHMYLAMDGLTGGGSDKLTVEYTVNYKTEHPTFPVWSPFLDDPAVVYPADRTVTAYKYIPENVTQQYTKYDPQTGAAKQESVTVPMMRLQAEEKKVNFPMASFKASGTKRNGVSVWHEYEYSWNAYRVE